jgi:hypothetical protein
MLARQVEAEGAFVNGDLGPRMERWSRRDPVLPIGQPVDVLVYPWVRRVGHASTIEVVSRGR